MQGEEPRRLKSPRAAFMKRGAFVSMPTTDAPVGMGYVQEFVQVLPEPVPS